MTEEAQGLQELLASMGAPAAANSRLKEEALERKLNLALSYAQNMPALAEMMPINPIQLPLWHTPAGESAAPAFKRNSIQELAAGSTGVGTVLDEDGNEVQNDLVVLRKLLASLADVYEQGFRGALFKDEDRQSMVAVRMLGLYALDAQTPIMPILYEIAGEYEEMTGPDMVHFNRTQIQGDRGGPFMCTLQQLALLCSLLQFNSSNLAPEYEASLASDQRSLRRSFLLPLGPLDSVQVAKVTYNAGCFVCGSATVKSCSGCKIERYCGPACQRAHWKDHKESCRYMQKGTWTDFIFTDAPTFNGQKLFGTMIDTSGSASQLKNLKIHGGDEGSGAPRNKHGDQAFIVKIQRLEDNIGMPELPPMQLFYDRFRTLKGYFEPESNTSVWSAFERSMPPGLNVKMYCWARRTGEWSLSVCLDRQPRDAEQIRW